MNRSRRRFLALSGLGLSSGAVGLAYVKGIRFPPLQLMPGEAPTHVNHDGIYAAAEGAIFQSVTDGALLFRAFVPEPRLALHGRDGQPWRVILQNTHPDASLSSSTPQSQLREERDNLTRIVVGRARLETTRLAWQFPKQDRFRFAAIGDTGGKAELQWVLQRAADLNADFVLHLGDFNYEDGDFERALKAFNAASIPTFAAIGNHEFHDGWRSTYNQFIQLIGPGNSAFSLGGIQFVNLDTAADFWPPYRGARMRLLQGLPALTESGPLSDYVAFTHRPLVDPDPARNHDINGPGEADWLRETLLGLGVKNLLVGHIHIKKEYDDAGLHTYISGQGLAHADLIVGKLVAEILVGDVQRGRPVQYHWAPLNMPFSTHCSARSWELLETIEQPEVLDRLRRLCGGTG